MQKGLPNTEMRHPAAIGLDAAPDAAILDLLLEGQLAAIAAVRPALSQIAKAAALMAEAQKSGQKIIYAAAGSSGIACLGDGAELPGTFGIDTDDLRIFMPGGIPQGAEMPGETEDDQSVAAEAMGDIAPGDVVIAVTASGSTPFTCEFARGSRRRGARVIAIANNAAARIFDIADIQIHVATPPEVIAGSTRLGAGSAQKAVLNLMSTLMGVRLGHVYDGMMVNLYADNAKLRARAAGIVAAVAGCRDDIATASLEQAGGRVKPAILIAAGAAGIDMAEQILAETGGHVRAALARVKDPVKAGT